MMIINCDTFEEFILSIAGMVREGCTFEAHARTLTITLTGGF